MKPQQASVAQTSVEDVKNSSALTSTATTTYIIVAGVLLLAFAAIAYSILRRRVPVLEKVHPDGDSESPSRFLKNKVSPGDLLHSHQEGEGELEGIEIVAAENRPERAAAAAAVGASSIIIGETLYGYLVRTLLSAQRVADTSLPSEEGKEVADFEVDDSEWRRSPPPQQPASDHDASNNSYHNDHDEDPSEEEQRLADYVEHIALSSDSERDDNILAIEISSDSGESNWE